MSVSLSKGGSVSLTKEAGGTLTAVTVGLGWDPSNGDIEYDLDASAILLGSNGMALSEKDFVFYGNPKSVTGAVEYGGDNRDGVDGRDSQTGGSGGDDDETIEIDLSKIPPACESIAIIVSIYEASSRGQSFGQVENAYIRVINDPDSRELARFDLTDGAASDTALTFGELYRDGSDWKFRAIGDGFTGGLAAVVTSFGITVA